MCCYWMVVNTSIAANIQTTIQLKKEPLPEVVEEFTLGRMRASNGLEFTCMESKQETLPNKEVCFRNVRTTEYWQFEVCLWKNASQVHLAGNHLVETRIHLGNFHAETTSEDEAIRKHSLIQGDGGRSAQIEFKCSNHESLTVLKWNEPSPLYYEIEVGAKSLCAHGTNPTLEDMGCLKSTLDGYDVKVCPGQMVTGQQQSQGKVMSFGNFDHRKVTPNRVVEYYVNGTYCMINGADVTTQEAEEEKNLPMRSTRVIYNCNPKAMMPHPKSMDTNQCHHVIRIATNQVCDTELKKVECFLHQDNKIENENDDELTSNIEDMN